MRLDRRGMWLIAAAGAVAISVSVLAIVRDPQDEVALEPRPNILIIVTDDQRDGMNVLPMTTRFFGRQGTTFSRGFTNTPLCCPARATLMSGQYPHNHGVLSNHDWKELDPQHTLQADLRRAGYRTAIFGKYLNHFPVELKDPPGFDRFAIFRAGGDEEDFDKETDYYSGGTWNIDGTVRTVDEYSTRVILEEGVGFIRSNSERPWLMILGVPSPHLPGIVEPAHEQPALPRWKGNRAVFEKDRSDKPPWVTRFDASLREGRSVRSRQLKLLRSADDVVGAVASALRESRQGSRTLAFFTTDNSYLWGEHGMLGKPSPYLQSLQVPLYARWPGRFAAGEVDSRLVSHIDITATAYDAADVVPGHVLDGRSLLGEYQRQGLLTEMLSVAKKMPKWSSLITGDGRHYIEYRRRGRILFRELYDLNDDPWELRNIAGLDAEAVAQLSSRLETVAGCRGNGCP